MVELGNYKFFVLIVKSQRRQPSRKLLVPPTDIAVRQHLQEMHFPTNVVERWRLRYAPFLRVIFDTFFENLVYLRICETFLSTWSLLFGGRKLSFSPTLQTVAIKLDLRRTTTSSPRCRELGKPYISSFMGSIKKYTGLSPRRINRNIGSSLVVGTCFETLHV